MGPRGRFGRRRFLGVIGIERARMRRHHAHPNVLGSLLPVVLYLFVLMGFWFVFGENVRVFWGLLLVVSTPALLAIIILVITVAAMIRQRRQIARKTSAGSRETPTVAN